MIEKRTNTMSGANLLLRPPTDLATYRRPQQDRCEQYLGRPVVHRHRDHVDVIGEIHEQSARHRELQKPRQTSKALQTKNDRQQA